MERCRRANRRRKPKPPAGGTWINLPPGLGLLVGVKRLHRLLHLAVGIISRHIQRYDSSHQTIENVIHKKICLDRGAGLYRLALPLQRPSLQRKFSIMKFPTRGYPINYDGRKKISWGNRWANGSVYIRFVCSRQSWMWRISTGCVRFKKTKGPFSSS